MNWMKLRYLYFVISALVIIPGLFSLFKYGLKLSIEFTGGTTLTLNKIENRESILKAFEVYKPEIEKTEDKNITLKMNPISQEEVTKIITSLKSEHVDISQAEFETVGPAIGKETINKTIIAIILSACLLLFFISSAFKQLKYGICAIMAMFHDTAVLLGIFSLLGHFYGVQIDLLFVTAMLTILSFSVHDTIVVYDRIREYSHKKSFTSFADLANQSVSETVIRSLNNSLTIIFMLLAMYLLGGDTTRYFSLALLVGTISGTYSSTFTAVPLLIVWDELSHKFNTRK